MKREPAASRQGRLVVRFPAPFTGRKAAFVVAILKRNRGLKVLDISAERKGHQLMNNTWAVIRGYERLTRPPDVGKLKGY